METEKLKSDIKALSKRIEELGSQKFNEEQTKTAFIMPFFQSLGYDVFNPKEFIPEFTADVGKKGERVDYAVVIEDKPAILIECKPISENLNKYWGQLFKYFIATNAKFGVLTDGHQVLFYTDLDETNKMDKKPFLIFNITKIKDGQIAEIAKFHKDNFDIETITSSASELKYLNAFKEFFEKNLANPSDEFSQAALKTVHDGKLTAKTKETLLPILTKAFKEFIREKVREELDAAFEKTNDRQEDESEEAVEDNKIVTTQEELDAYAVVKAAVQDVIDPDRVFYRDTQRYFGILLDDTNRKWFLRYFQQSVKSTIEIRNVGKFEVKSPIDIVRYSKEIKQAIQKIEE